MVLADGAAGLVSGIILFDEGELWEARDEIGLCFVEGFGEQFGREGLLDVFGGGFFEVVQHDVDADSGEAGAWPAEAVEHVDGHFVYGCARRQIAREKKRWDRGSY